MTNDWRSFKGIHAGQSCVVICNGKSLADVKLDQITVCRAAILMRFTDD